MEEKSLFTLIFGNILLPAQATTICNSCRLNKLMKSLTDRNVIVKNPVAILIYYRSNASNVIILSKQPTEKLNFNPNEKKN